MSLSSFFVTSISPTLVFKVVTSVFTVCNEFSTFLSRDVGTKVTSHWFSGEFPLLVTC